jgi:hypothetical protein
VTFYVDEDDDGWGLETTGELFCEDPGLGWADTLGDCDDDDDAISPSESEDCNGVDDNCDGDIDNDDSCPCDVRTREDRAYMFCDDRSDWNEALTGCREEDNYDLVTIDDAAEQAWLYTNIAEISSSAWWWIGYNDLEGAWADEPADGWEWVDGSSPDPVYENWADGQPDNYYWWESSAGEHCGHIYGSNGKWNDLRCAEDRAGSTNMYYICEASVD